MTNPEFGFPSGYVHSYGVVVLPPVGVPVVKLVAQDKFVASSRHRSLYDEEDLYDAFYMPPQIRHVAGILSDLVVKRLYTLEETFKAMEVHSTPDLDSVDMCLVSRLIVPQKFKVLDFNKYKRVICIHTHLRAYCHKMAAYTDNDKLLIHYFQDTLSGASLEWHMKLETSHI